MSTPQTTPRRSGRLRHLAPERLASSALLGAAVPGGWVLHDLVVFSTRGEPAASLALLPGSAVAVALGAVIGLAVGYRPVLLVLIGALSLAATAASLTLEIPVSRAQIWLPRVIFLSSVVFGATSALQSAWRLGILRLGLTGGFLACLAKSVFRFGMNVQSPPWIVFGLLVLGLGFLRRSGLRRLATLVCLAVPAVELVRRAERNATPSRPDLPLPEAPASDGPNLLLIVLDTVRADRLAPYGHERVTTPGLDAWVAEHATIYTESRSTSPFTLSSHASLFTGLYPAEHGATHPRPSQTVIREDVPTLAERLRGEGYQTAAIVANTIYLNPGYGLDRGYEHFDDRRGCWVFEYLALPQYTGLGIQTGHLSYRDAESITDSAIRWLDESRRSGAFFLTLNYLDAHAPYLPPSPFDRAFGGRRPIDPLNIDTELVSLLYDRSLLYLDSQLTRLLTALEDRALLEDTVVIVTSDHGESLGDHGLFAHCWYLYEGLVKVPLYVKPVGREPEAIVAELVTSADVHGIALRELGFEAARHVPFPGLIGEWHPSLPLVPLYANWKILTQEEMERDLIAWVDGRTKFIVSSAGAVEAYDLDQDPDELRPLELTRETIESAVERARTWWIENRVFSAPQGEADAETRARMEALGYGGG